MTNTQEWQDPQTIYQLIQNWVIWRDGGDWERFKTLWHEGARMHATWFQGPALDFIKANQEGWRKGVRIYHSLGGTSIDVQGDRAIAQTKAAVTQRAEVDGVECDVTCTCRFYDFLEKQSGRWGIILRQGVSAPRLSADTHRLHGQKGYAPIGGARAGSTLQERKLVASGWTWPSRSLVPIGLLG